MKFVPVLVQSSRNRWRSVKSSSSSSSSMVINSSFFVLLKESKMFTLSAVVWPQMSPSLCFRKKIRVFYSSPTCSPTLIPLVMLEVQSWAFFHKLGPKSNARSTTYTLTLCLNFVLQLMPPTLSKFGVKVGPKLAYYGGLYLPWVIPYGIWAYPHWIPWNKSIWILLKFHMENTMIFVVKDSVKYENWTLDSATHHMCEWENTLTAAPSNHWKTIKWPRYILCTMASTNTSTNNSLLLPQPPPPPPPPTMPTHHHHTTTTAHYQQLQYSTLQCPPHSCRNPQEWDQ